MAIVTGSRSIAFTWCPETGESGTTPTDYLLSCQTDSYQTDSCQTDCCPPMNGSTIQNQSSVKYDCFAPNTTYTCYLSAVDNNGIVGPNETSTVQTLEDGEHIPKLLLLPSNIVHTLCSIIVFHVSVFCMPKASRHQHVLYGENIDHTLAIHTMTPVAFHNPCSDLLCSSQCPYCDDHHCTVPN